MTTSEISRRVPVDGRYKYYLNDDATLKKLKKHANNKDFEDKSDALNDNSFTFQFSTGSYIHSVVPLVDFWRGSSGNQIDPDDTDGLQTSVVDVKTENDASGKTIGHIVKLQVDGQDVTITTYDTQVKVRVQGKKAMEQYTTRALVPYLLTEIKTNAVKILKVNQYFVGLINHPKTTSYSCKVCDEKFPFKTQLKKHEDVTHKTERAKHKSNIKLKLSPNLNFSSSNLAILSEQQLDSDMSGMESLDDSLMELPLPKAFSTGVQQPIIDLESDEQEPQEEPTRSSTPNPKQEKVPAPPPTWARFAPPLPEGYSLGDAKTLPASFLEQALATLTKVSNLPGQQEALSPALPDPLQLGCSLLPPTHVLTQEHIPTTLPPPAHPQSSLSNHISAPQKEVPLQRSPQDPANPQYSLLEAGPHSLDEADPPTVFDLNPTPDSYFLCPESGLLKLHPLSRRSVIRKAPPKPQFEPNKENTIWPEVIIVNEEIEASEKDNNVKVNQDKPTPGVGKQRSNPVTASVPPSFATFAACNNPTHAHPVQPNTHEDLQYKCDECDFSANWAGEFFNHKIQVHKLQVPGASSDPLLFFLAEQNEEYRTKLIEAMVNVQSLTEQIQLLTTQVAKVVENYISIKCTKCNYIAANTSVMLTHMETKHNVRSTPQPTNQSKRLVPDILSASQKQEQIPQQKKQNIPQQKKQQIPQQQQEPPPSPFHSPSAQLPTYAEQARGPHAQAHSFNCTVCRYKCSNQAKLKEHISAKHEEPSQRAPFTLLIGDSRVKSLMPRIIEKALGNGVLSVPGSIRVPVQPQGRGKGHPGRAYCSSRDWPGAKFPAASLEDRVPELLAARSYTNLVLQAPSNDITNILKIQDLSKHQELAEQSARNTLAVVEQALRVHPSLQKAIILEHLPRADNDHLGRLSEHSNNVLREIVALSNLRNRITIASSKALECNTEAKIVKMFGARDSPRSDGIHLMGENGKQLYTDFVVDSIRSANLAWVSPFPRHGARQASRSENGHGEQGSYATGNRFGPLSN